MYIPVLRHSGGVVPYVYACGDHDVEADHQFPYNDCRFSVFDDVVDDDNDNNRYCFHLPPLLLEKDILNITPISLSLPYLSSFYKTSSFTSVSACISTQSLFTYH